MVFHFKKGNFSLHDWIFVKNLREKFVMTIIGFIISLMLLVNSRKILVPFSAIFVWLIIYLPIFTIGRANLSNYVLSIIFIILVLSVYLFLAYFIKFSKRNNFEVEDGSKIFLKSPLFKAPFIMTFIIFLLFLIVTLIDIFNLFLNGVPIPHNLLYYLIRLIFVPSMSFFALLFYILFMMAIPSISPIDYIQYSINVLKSKDSFLLKKSKLYCLLTRAYISYEKETMKHFGKESKEIFNYDSILKLRSFVSTIDIDDKVTIKKLLEILNDLNRNLWFEQTNDFKKILNKIDDFTGDIEIKIESLKKRLFRQKIKQYIYIVISSIAIIINSIFFILNHFQ